MSSEDYHKRKMSWPQERCTLSVSLLKILQGDWKVHPLGKAPLSLKSVSMKRVKRVFVLTLTTVPQKSSNPAKAHTKLCWKRKLEFDALVKESDLKGVASFACKPRAQNPAMPMLTAPDRLAGG
ncbi:hypothetical protein BGZ65_005942, partial [Modicella reniformis]